MLCPICDKVITFVAGDKPVINVETYQKTAVAKTACCRNMVRLAPYTGYRATLCDAEVDDWGNPATKRRVK